MQELSGAFLLTRRQLVFVPPRIYRANKVARYSKWLGHWTSDSVVAG